MLEQLQGFALEAFGWDFERSQAARGPMMLAGFTTPKRSALLFPISMLSACPADVDRSYSQPPRPRPPQPQM
jgi:hypothetical protein